MLLLLQILTTEDSSDDRDHEDDGDDQSDAQDGQDQPLDLTIKKKRRLEKEEEDQTASFCLLPDSSATSSSSSQRLCQDFKSGQRLLSFDRNGQYRMTDISSPAPSSYSLCNLRSSSSCYSLEEEKEGNQSSIERLIHSVEKSAAQAASIMASVRGRNAVSEGTTLGSPSLEGMLSASGLSGNVVPSNTNQRVLLPHDVFLSQVHQKLLEQQHHLQMQQEEKQLQLQRNQGNHRTVIKQKLEDAFRENGFLVKTKQVSDGDATFCKFRQLRKYTRYYLKSWHKHLPDEVNKLYKGFLPPKTATSGGGQTPSSGRSRTKTPPQE